MKHKPGRLRIIITNEPEKYTNEQIQGQLEFTNNDPATLIKKLEEKGFLEALLVGGGNINSLFFKAKLVNEFILTIEPKLLGEGNGLVSEEELDVHLELESVEKLNPQGTLLLKYQVR